MSRALLKCGIGNLITTRSLSKPILSYLPSLPQSKYTNICVLYRCFADKRDVGKAVSVLSSFSNLGDKDKGSYLEMIRIYKAREKLGRGEVEFIYAALKAMEEFGVEKDLEVYKTLINVMPKGKYVAQNLIQAEFMHYPKQQQCIIDLLVQMGKNGVIPDVEMESMLLNTFGKRGFAVRRYWRMMYWLPKFKNMSPFPLPHKMPQDSLELARLAIERITSVDVRTCVSVYQTSEVPDALENTWVVSGQSSEQQDLLAEHPSDLPAYIEGPGIVWLRDQMVTYFVLKTGPRPIEVHTVDYDDISHLWIPLFMRPPADCEKRVARLLSVHEQEQGTIYAVCATGTSGRDSLLSWVRLLETQGNPRLAEIPVLFKLRGPHGEEKPRLDCEKEGTTDASQVSQLTDRITG